MSEEERHTVTYTGSPIGARRLVSMIESEGAEVEWEPPTERRDLGSAAEATVVALVVWGSKAAITAAVRRFRKRYPRSRIEIDDEDDRGYL